MTNIVLYKSFSGESIDVEAEVEKFLREPVRSYVQESINLVLPALARALKLKATIYQIDSAGQVMML